MRILVTGASGFIASQIITNLLQANHEVVCCARNIEYTQALFPDCRVIPCDFIRDTSLDQWLPRLDGIDAVVNCVGIFYHPNPKIVWAVHYDTPRALFDACVQKGVKKIIHISALGVDKSEVIYAQTKKAADDYLLTLPLPSVIIRPSFVYGRGSYGGSSLFRGLAGFPLITPVPGKGEQQFQPIHLDDLAKAVEHLIAKEQAGSQILNAVSTQKVSLKEILTKMRSWLGFAKAKLISIPLIFIRLASLAGDLIPYSALNTVSYKMMANDSITSDDEMRKFHEAIGFIPRNYSQGLYSQPSTVQDHWHARLFFLKIPLRVSIAFVWIMTAVTTLFFYPQSSSLDLLQQAGVPQTWQSPLFYTACIWNGLLGLGMLLNIQLRKVGVAQLATIGFYTLFLTLKLPLLWLEPFAPLAKNIPLMVSILVCMAMESDR